MTPERKFASCFMQLANHSPSAWKELFARQNPPGLKYKKNIFPFGSGQAQMKEGQRIFLPDLLTGNNQAGKDFSPGECTFQRYDTSILQVAEIASILQWRRTGASVQVSYAVNKTFSGC